MIACPACGAEQPPEELARLPAEPLFDGPDVRCRACGAGLWIELFPALVRPPEAVDPGERVLDDATASCFFHADKQAEVACEGCGRFVCALCDLEIRGRHLCPSCVAGGQRRDAPELATRRTLYDGIALALALYPLLIFYFTLVTAPAALYFCIRHRHSPGSLVRRRRWRFAVAALLATLQIGGWVALAAFLVSRFS